MYIFCPRCGEPWDIASLNGDMSEEEAKDLGRGKGCPCCFGRDVTDRPIRAEASEVLLDILGNDLDGAAAMLEDFGF